MNPSHLPERREKQRVAFRTRITLIADRSRLEVEGSSLDLSMGGVFIATAERPPVATRCHLNLVLTGLAAPLSVDVQGTVVRHTETGIAVAFDSMDLDSYAHLKNIIRHNCPDPDSVF